MEKQRIITSGLTQEQNDFVVSCLPNCSIEVLTTDAISDLMAINHAVAIISGRALEEDPAPLFSYYRDVKDCTDETVIWLSEPLPPTDLRKFIKCYRSFEAVQDKLKYLILGALSKSKRAVEYSTKLVIGLKILSLIRKCPGISTKELAERVSVPTRTVQRTIAALQAAGEWIEYDRSLRGWKLFNGVSILFGDVWNGGTE